MNFCLFWKQTFVVQCEAKYSLIFVNLTKKIYLYDFNYPQFFFYLQTNSISSQFTIFGLKYEKSAI